MTPTKHTPGPWDFDLPYIVAPYPTGKHPDLYIAEIVYADEDGRLPPDDEQDANGRLIAAAPELLDSLVELTHEIARKMPSERRAEIVSRAQAVISAVLAA